MEEEIVLMEENDIEEISIEEENYSGKPYILPIASKNVLGGIKIGENLTIDEDGTLNAQASGGDSVPINSIFDYEGDTAPEGYIEVESFPSGGIAEETDPTVPDYVKAIKQEDIDKWNSGTGNIDLTDYAKKTDIPTKISQLINDSNFINSIKTINGQSIEGEGNIVIEGGSGGETSNVVVSPTEPLTGEDVWFKKSVNLFNKSTINSSSRITNQGIIGKDDASANVTDFIKVIPNEQYTIQGCAMISSRCYNYYYDINQEPISGFVMREGIYTITIPENAYYMRFTIYNKDINNFQFEKGSIASDYQEYSEDKIYTLTNNSYEEFKPVSSVEEKQMMTIKLTEEYYLDAPTAWARYALPLNKILSSMGNGFILTPEGRIKVGKGVSKISMIASSLVLRYNNTGEFDIGIRIFRNGSQVLITASYTYFPVVSKFVTVNLIVPLVDVQENDEIELSCTTAIKDRFRFSVDATYLSVKKEA